MEIVHAFDVVYIQKILRSSKYFGYCFHGEGSVFRLRLPC